jgi:hypothetical protein
MAPPHNTQLAQKEGRIALAVQAYPLVRQPLPTLVGGTRLESTT